MYNLFYRWRRCLFRSRRRREEEEEEIEEVKPMEEGSPPPPPWEEEEEMEEVPESPVFHWPGGLRTYANGLRHVRAPFPPPFPLLGRLRVENY